MWQKLTVAEAEEQFLVFAGEQDIQLEACRMLPWKTAFEVV